MIIALLEQLHIMFEVRDEGNRVDQVFIYIYIYNIKKLKKKIIYKLIEIIIIIIIMNFIL